MSGRDGETHRATGTKVVGFYEEGRTDDWGDSTSGDRGPAEGRSGVFWLGVARPRGCVFSRSEIHFSALSPLIRNSADALACLTAGTNLYGAISTRSPKESRLPARPMQQRGSSPLAVLSMCAREARPPRPALTDSQMLWPFAFERNPVRGKAASIRPDSRVPGGR